MKSARETEIKLKVEGARALKRRLRECGFVVVQRCHMERNFVFDFRDSRLRRSRSLLRLRTEGSRHILTFKGPPHPSKSYKIRTEIEVEVEDASALRRIFEALGLRVNFLYEKYRTTYAKRGQREAGGRPLLVYDETPVGHYLELEGPARWIDQVAHRLGYEKRDYITSSYAALYQEYCRKNKIKPGNMIFAGSNS